MSEIIENSKPLNESELKELRVWQNRMVYMFVFTTLFFISAIVYDLFIGLSGRSGIFIFILMLVTVCIDGIIQFTQKCPRCGYRIGLQSRLTLPEKCKNCGVVFK